MPTKNSGLICSADWTCGIVRPAAERERGQARRLRLDVGLAEEEGEAGAEQHQRDADGDVVHLRAACRHSRGSAPKSDPAHAGREHAEPRRAGLVGDGVAGHGAEDERALEAEIDAAGFLGQALAEADEEERRRDADGAGEHGEEDDDEARFAVHR